MMRKETYQMGLSLLEWKPMPRNSLRGFATVRYGSLKIRDVTVHNNGTRRWANMPSKPMVGSDGMALKDDSGKIKYVPILEWANKDAADKFSEEVLAAVEREHAGATSA
jgi:hypothetical protein